MSASVPFHPPHSPDAVRTSTTTLNQLSGMNDFCTVSNNHTLVGTSQSNLLSLDHVTTTNKTVNTKPNRRFHRHGLPLSCPKSHNTNTVINLSHHALTDTQTDVLSKNLNFCPTPKNVNYVELSKDVHSFTLRLRLAEFFYDEETDLKENETILLMTKIMRILMT
ncbi:flagellar protein FliL [Elysia marginata]|uniref:Flagellar protein FliL n=1 Tax=Elysia marginata TaxID=1093978 RepID=A0AAV4ETE4_9GAST|nr:flagellar protein FliL [Elysia marginata]